MGGRSYVQPSFNSRSREGSDGCLLYDLSIDIRFNSRSREGSDCWVVGKLPVPSEFQFTLPRGERRLVVVSTEDIDGFNSRSREGSD